MQTLNINNTLACIFYKYTKILLTGSCFCVHTSLNTPAKPMLFSNNMLKLSGLFFACRIHTTTPPFYSNLSGGLA